MGDDASQWAGILGGQTAVRARDAARQRLAAALVDAARAMRAARARHAEPSAEMRAMRARRRAGAFADRRFRLPVSDRA
jgi:hypothetical protein